MPVILGIQCRISVRGDLLTMSRHAESILNEEINEADQNGLRAKRTSVEFPFRTDVRVMKRNVVDLFMVNWISWMKSYLRVFLALRLTFVSVCLGWRWLEGTKPCVQSVDHEENQSSGRRRITLTRVSSEKTTDRLITSRRICLKMTDRDNCLSINNWRG